MVVLATVATFTAVWLGCPSSDSRGLRRLRHADVRQARSGTSLASALIEDARNRFVVCLVASGAAGWLVLGPSLAAVCAVPLGLGLSWWLGTLESPSITREREEIARDLPVAVDLLAACALVGRPPDQSLAVVARAVGGRLGARLDEVNSRLALGADPQVEWKRVLTDAQLAPLARTMLRTLESGAPLVDGLTRLAADRRRERRASVQARARTVGVKAAGPLAVCFLPAFMLIGVVPTIVGAFTHLVL
ncbi:MAG: type II secretion system F family protein [Nocardioidaceae bacterium]|nr:type II secretion system F family protein [Nocardioidaceae bacterium]